MKLNLGRQVAAWANLTYLPQPQGWHSLMGTLCLSLRSRLDINLKYERSYASQPR